MQPQLKSFHLAKRALATAFLRHTIYRIRARLFRAWSIVREWVCRWRFRHELRSLSQREIADFCPKLTEALKEAEKPFWRS